MDPLTTLSVVAGVSADISKFSNVLKGITEPISSASDPKQKTEDTRLTRMIDEANVYQTMMAEAASMLASLRTRPPASAGVTLAYCGDAAHRIIGLANDYQAAIIDIDVNRKAGKRTPKDDFLSSGEPLSWPKKESKPNVFEHFTKSFQSAFSSRSKEKKYEYDSDIKPWTEHGLAAKLEQREKDILVEVQDALRDLRTYSTLVRQIATDAVSHELLRDQRSGRLNTRQDLSDAEYVGQNGSDVDTDSAAEQGTDDETGDRIHTILRRSGRAKDKQLGRLDVHSRERSSVRDPYNQFGAVSPASAIAGTLMWHPLRIQIDTRSNVNIISGETLEEMNFEGLGGRFDEPRLITCDTVSGQFEVERRVTLRWTFNNGTKTRKSRFYVLDGAPFDMLIGLTVINSHNVLKEIRSKKFQVMFTPWLRGRTNSEKIRADEERRRKDQEALDARGRSPGTSPNPSVLVNGQPPPQGGP